MGPPDYLRVVAKEWGQLHSVGRLDYNSEGLLFLTNDGEFSLRLTHPRYGCARIYCHGGRPVAEEMLAASRAACGIKASN